MKDPAKGRHRAKTGKIRQRSQGAAGRAAASRARTKQNPAPGQQRKQGSGKKKPS